MYIISNWISSFIKSHIWLPDRKDVLYELLRMSQCSTPGLLQTAQELADVTLLNEDVLQLPEGWNTDTALPEGWRLKRSTPDLPDDRWNSLDLELCQLQGLLHHDLGQGSIPAHLVADQYGSLLNNFLSSKEDFREEVTLCLHKCRQEEWRRLFGGQ